MGLQNIDRSDKKRYNNSVDTEQYERYKKVLKSMAPKTLEAFKTLKYDNPEQWKSLKNKYRVVNQYKIDSGDLSPEEIFELDDIVITEKRTQFTSDYKRPGNIAGAYINNNKKICTMHIAKCLKALKVIKVHKN